MTKRERRELQDLAGFATGNGDVCEIIARRLRALLNDEPLPDAPPEVDEFLEHARTEMFPKLKDSALSITIMSDDPDPKMCIELGAALLFDKPLILLVTRNEAVPPTLARVASAVIVGNMDEDREDFGRRINAAIADVLANDPRAKGPQ